MWQPEVDLKERRRILFDAYIQRRLARSYRGEKNSPKAHNGQKSYPNDDYTKKWLGWLADCLIDEEQTELFVENLQPYFLPSRFQIFIYELCRGLILGIIGGLILGSCGGLVSGLAKGSVHGVFYGMSLGLILGLLGGLLVGIFSAVGKTNHVEMVETIQLVNITKPRSLKESLIDGLVFGFSSGLIVGMVLGLFGWIVVDKSFGLIYGLAFGVFGWIIIAPLHGIIKSMIGAEISLRLIENQGVRRSLTNAIFFGFMLLPIGILIALSISAFTEVFTLIEAPSH
jgi:hypothetical protein